MTWRSFPNKSLAAAMLVAVAILAVALRGRAAHGDTPAFVTATVARGTIEDAVQASGKLEPKTLVSVGARASGQVVKLYVKVGDRVQAGQRIAEIDSLLQQNALRNSEAALQNVAAQRVARSASLEQARLIFERQKTLYATDATSREAFQTARATYLTTKAEVDALDAQVRQATVAVDSARVDLGYTHIVAPSAGVVVAVVTEEGRTVNAFQSAPTIVMLANLDVMKVRAQISEADVVRVKPGQAVYFTILGRPDARYWAKLRSVEPAPASIANDNTSSQGASASTQADAAIYYNGLFELPNPGGELRPMMTAQVRIVQGIARDVPTVAATALDRRRGDRATVRVVGADGTAQPRQIRTGLDNRDTLQVVSGLKIGEKVVIGDAAGATPGGETRWR